MSHHLDSPLARQDPRLNVTDQYLFDADEATVLVMNVHTSLSGDTHPDQLHPEARYEFKVHLDGQPYEDLTFRFAFTPTTPAGQGYTLERLSGDAARQDGGSGDVIARGFTDGDAVALPGGGRVWAGEAAEPFYLDLKQLDAVVAVVQHGADAELTGFGPGARADTFAGSTVRSIVLSIPWTDPDLRPGRRVATWSTTKLATDAGGWRQVGRAGLPMIWPIFRDADSDEASRANETHPARDGESYAAAIGDLVAAVVGHRGRAEQPRGYADAVMRRIVPDLLAYTVGTPATFGFAEFNGRRLTDYAPEAMFSLATNSAITTGLVPEGPCYQTAFPYVVPASR